jgi:hypothetical protein
MMTDIEVKIESLEEVEIAADLKEKKESLDAIADMLYEYLPLVIAVNCITFVEWCGGCETVRDDDCTVEICASCSTTHRVCYETHICPMTSCYCSSDCNIRICEDCFGLGSDLVPCGSPNGGRRCCNYIDGAHAEFETIYTRSPVCYECMQNYCQMCSPYSIMRSDGKALYPTDKFRSICRKCNDSINAREGERYRKRRKLNTDDRSG